jgi:hypothetical protein
MTEGESPMTPEFSPMTRRDRNKLAVARLRGRRRLGLVLRTIRVQREWLDALEARGYLDPWDRTIAEAEVAAIEKCLGDHLVKNG